MSQLTEIGELTEIGVEVNERSGSQLESDREGGRKRGAEAGGDGSLWEWSMLREDGGHDG